VLSKPVYLTLTVCSTKHNTVQFHLSPGSYSVLFTNEQLLKLKNAVWN
jgi:hypothetical protein